MPTIDNWRALQETVAFAERIQAQSVEMEPAAIRSLLDERDQLARSLALVQQHHATAWNRGHTIGMAAQEETARKALEAVKADAWGNAQLTEALLAAEAERDRLTAEQQVLREWIAEALPVLASVDDCEDMEPLRALIESGRRLVDGGPDDLLAGVE